MEAKLIINDEVIVQINGLDLATRKKLHEKFKFEIPGAKYQPSVRLGRWDGKKSFFSLSGLTYINILPEILVELEKLHCEIDVVDNRKYNNKFEFDPFTEDTFAGAVWPAGHYNAGQPVMFRDYQVAIVNGFIANQQSITSASTGSGKTIVTAALSKLVEKFGRSIIIVPSTSLVTQTEEDYINLGLDVGVYYGGRKEIGHTHTICTWQSLNVLKKNSEGRYEDSPADRLRKDPTDFIMSDLMTDAICVIVDECHQIKAAVLSELLSGPFAKLPLRFGFTGTIPKEKIDELSLICHIGPIIGQLSAKDLQDAGHLANCHINVVQMIDHVEFKEYQAELKYLTENVDRISYLARLIEKIKESGNTLILVDRIATGKMLQIELSTVASLLGEKPDITFISGAMKAKDRKAEFEEIAASSSRITIASYGTAAVGINIPSLRNLVLLEPGKSFVRVIQSIGRGLRKSQGKDSVTIYDITSTCKFSKRHLSARKKFYDEAEYPFTVEKVKWQ